MGLPHIELPLCREPLLMPWPIPGNPGGFIQFDHAEQWRTFIACLGMDARIPDVVRITTERLRRGVFTSVPELVAAIEAYVAHHNIQPKPFIWTKSARDILQKVIRANNRLSSKQNAALH